MRVPVFAMERYQSLHEHDVAHNLSESGVHAPSFGELRLLVPGIDEGLDDVRLGYVQTNGSVALRNLVAASFHGATADNVEVTNGAAEANACLVLHLVEPGDHVVFMTPNYLQARDVLEVIGADITDWPLRRVDGRWCADIDALASLVRPDTRLICVCTPNNPTGARLTATELDEIAAIADSVGAWVLSDEIYAGAELDGTPSPSMWGRTPRAICTGGLSKAFGLAGVRIGWLVGPSDVVDACWSVHDHVTICPGALSDHIATAVLQPHARAALVDRTRRILSANLGTAEELLGTFGDHVSWTKPEAGGMLFLRYDAAIGSTELAERLRVEDSVLLVPGDHFGMDHHVRIGYGCPRDSLTAGLDAMVRHLR